jgi:hypothetical protein
MPAAPSASTTTRPLLPQSMATEQPAHCWPTPHHRPIWPGSVVLALRHWPTGQTFLRSPSGVDTLTTRTGKTATPLAA